MTIEQIKEQFLANAKALAVGEILMSLNQRNWASKDELKELLIIAIKLNDKSGHHLDLHRLLCDATDEYDRREEDDEIFR